EPPVAPRPGGVPERAPAILKLWFGFCHALAQPIPPAFVSRSSPTAYAKVSDARIVACATRSIRTLDADASRQRARAFVRISPPVSARSTRQATCGERDPGAPGSVHGASAASHVRVAHPVHTGRFRAVRGRAPRCNRLHPPSLRRGDSPRFAAG